MRYRAMFLAGLAVGFVLGARAGRERYEQIVERFINPALGDITMTKLRPLHIESAVALWRKMTHAKDAKKKQKRKQSNSATSQTQSSPQT